MINKKCRHKGTWLIDCDDNGCHELQGLKPHAGVPARQHSASRYQTLKRRIMADVGVNKFFFGGYMAATLERKIYEAIRGQCISDASAERAAALAAELAVEKFTPTNSAMVPCPHWSFVEGDDEVLAVDVCNNPLCGKWAQHQ